MNLFLKKFDMLICIGIKDKGHVKETTKFPKLQ